MEKINVGERIRTLRELNHYSREYLAEKVEVSSKFLYEIELGKKGFSADILCRIALALSVSCDYIMYGEMNNNMSAESQRVMSLLNMFNDEQVGKVLEILESIYSLSK